jgi:hypothetical protein
MDKLSYRRWFNSYKNIPPATTPIDNKKTIMYPGSACDFGPLWHFAEHYGIRRAFYIDYMLDFCTIPEALYNITRDDFAEDPSCTKGYRTVQIKDFQQNQEKDIWDEFYTAQIGSSLNGAIYEKIKEHLPEYRIERVDFIFPWFFGPYFYSWKDFYYPDNLGKFFPDGAHCFRVMLQRPDGDLIELFYFKTEAIQTYDILLRLGYQINVMVIQEHGFGGTPFGGRSRLYDVARQNNKFPEYLFTAEGHTLWPGYTQAEEPILIYRGQFFNNKRAVCIPDKQYDHHRDEEDTRFNDDALPRVISSLVRAE